MSDVGGGHRAAADAVLEAIKRSYKPSDYSFKIVDLYFIGSKFCHFSLQSCPFFLRNLPWIYNRFFDFNNWKLGWEIIYKVFIEPFMMENVKELILKEKPDIILSTYALCNRITFDALEKLNLLDKIFTVCLALDLFVVHRTWAEPRANISFVATEEARKAIIKYGVPEEKIILTSFPINPAFEEPVDKEKVLKELGFSQNKFTVMIMGGGEGLGDVHSTAKIIYDHQLDVQLIVIAGRNQELVLKLKSLQELSHNPWAIFGFTERIAELMSIADVLITKPGPATLMEALAKELPVIAVGRMPRQEESNIEFVREKGIGYVVKRPEEIISIMKRLISDNQELQNIQQNIKREKKLTSAYEIARSIMGHN